MREAIEMAKQAWKYGGHNVLMLPLVALNGFACLTSPEVAQVVGFMGWACTGGSLVVIIAHEVIAGLQRDCEHN